MRLNFGRSPSPPLLPSRCSPPPPPLIVIYRRHFHEEREREELHAARVVKKLLFLPLFSGDFCATVGSGKRAGGFFFPAFCSYFSSSSTKRRRRRIISEGGRERAREPRGQEMPRELDTGWSIHTQSDNSIIVFFGRGFSPTHGYKYRVS